MSNARSNLGRRQGSNIRRRFHPVLSRSRPCHLGSVTDNGREFCGIERQLYEPTLELNDIEHRRTRIATPRTNGFVERFSRTILEEFFRTKVREKTYTSIETDRNAWLEHYNEERPHRGYRNMGRRPIDTVNKFAQTARQEAQLFT
jgi:transposase InsO family protein